MDVPEYSTDFPSLQTMKNKTLKSAAEQRAKDSANVGTTLEPALHQQLNVVEIIFVLAIGATTAIGIAQCLMCLWTHVGQKKTFDCALRREVGSFRLGCSLHLSHRHAHRGPAPSPRLSLAKQQSCSGLSKQLSRLDSAQLSSSLSSLRAGPGVAGTHLGSGRSSRVARSADFLSKTQSNTSGSWL